MGRLTNEQGSKCRVCIGSIRCDDKVKCIDERMYQKLKHYEDLEEAGRLIELPCAVGGRVYFILENNEIDSQLIDNVQTSLFFRGRNGIKKGFYLTKEEAEAKLRDLLEIENVKVFKEKFKELKELEGDRE